MLPLMFVFVWGHNYKGNMNTKREIEIRDKRTGQVLRETYTPDSIRLFGVLELTPKDLLSYVGLVITIIIFFVNGQNDKKIMQQNLAEMKVTTSRLVDFRDNSDAWDSQVYGTRFRNGEPVDSNFKMNNRGTIYKTTSSMD